MASLTLGIEVIPRLACFVMPRFGFGALDVQQSQGVESFMKNGRFSNVVGFVASLGWNYLAFRVLR